MEEEILNEIENIESSNQNEIIEVDENDEITNTQYDLVGLNEATETKKKKKKKGPSKWSKLTKKQKIIIITICVVLLLIIIALLVYFLVFKKDGGNTGKPDEPIVIIEKDNYRYESGTLVFTDDNKKELGSYECENKNETLCFVAYYSNEDEFDIAKKVYENGNPIDTRSDIINERFVFVYDGKTDKNGKLKLYDIKEEKTLGEYDLVKEVKDNSVIISENGKYGLIKLDGELTSVIDSKYDYLGFIEDTNAVVASNNGNYSLVDLNGKSISKEVPGEIKSFSDKLISVSSKGSYYLYGYDGKKILDKEFDYIRFVDSLAITASSKKLSVYDESGNKMNGEDIKVSNSNYNTKLIFNDDLRQVGKEESFNAYLNNSILKIELEDDKININLNDGLFSKNLSYISYYAGKLYFYSDEAKENLLGTYSCNYANSVNESTTNLENCFIAKETNIIKKGIEDKASGYLPIYNKRYVFIADTKAPSANDNIILYDLKTNKKLATYKEVDTEFHDTTNIVNFIDTAGTLVYAKNTNDSYGIVNILDSSVKGVLGFKNDETGATNESIGMFNDYILVKSSDKINHLYDLSKINTANFEITKNIKTTSEIIDYKYGYLKVKNESGNYQIYSLDGKITSEEAKYLVMESKFYILVSKDKNLGVYKYTDNKNLVDNIQIDSEEYEKDLSYTLNGNILTVKYVVDKEPLSIDINLE